MPGLAVDEDQRAGDHQYRWHQGGAPAHQQLQEMVDLEADHAAVPAQELDAAEEDSGCDQPTADQVTTL
jgi:hypothetical protein